MLTLMRLAMARGLIFFAAGVSLWALQAGGDEASGAGSTSGDGAQLRELLAPFSRGPLAEPGCPSPEGSLSRWKQWSESNNRPMPALDCGEIVRLLAKDSGGCGLSPASCELLLLACHAPDASRMTNADYALRSYLSLKCALTCRYPALCPLENPRFLLEPIHRFRLELQRMPASDNERLGYVRLILDAATQLAIAYPDVGPLLGPALRDLLEHALDASDSRSPEGLNAQDQETLRAWLKNVVAFDQEDIAGTSHFYAASRWISRTDALIQLRDRVEIPIVFQLDGQIRKHLLEGARLLRTRPPLWEPFEAYSDFLYGLFKEAQGEPMDENIRDRLAELSTLALRRGILLYLERIGAGVAPLAPFEAARNKLFARVDENTRRLQRELRYSQSACYLQPYLTPGLLRQDQLEQLNALSAQANYLLNRPWEEYFRRSGKTLTIDALQELKRDIGDLVTQEGQRPCTHTDW